MAMSRTQLSFASITFFSAACAVPPPSQPSERAALLEGGPAGTRPAAAPAAQEVRDYSANSLFLERHAGFMQRMNRYEPRVFASFMALPDAEVKGEPGSFDLAQLRARGDFRFAVDPNSYLSAGGEFRLREYEFSPAVRGATDETLYQVGARLGAGYFVNDDLLLEGMFRPGVYTDFDGTLTGQDWKWLGSAQGTYRHSEDLFFRAGLAVSEDFKDVNLIPLAGLSWLFLPQWRLDIALPHKIEVSWSTHGATTTVYGGIYLEGDEWRVRNVTNLGKRRFDVQTQEIKVGGGAVHRLTDNLSVFGDAGVIVAGDYHFRDGLGQRYDGSLDPSFQFTVGVGLDF
jgi:hypothetical protein